MEAEKNASDTLKRLQARFEKGIKDLNTKIQEKIVAPDTDSPVILDRDFLNRSGDRISEQALQLGALHRTARLNATTMEECIQRILEILNDFYMKIARAQFVAEHPLVYSLSGSIAELTNRSQILLKRSLGYGPYGYRDNFDGIPELARDVFDAYKSYVNDPKIRALLTLASIFDVARTTTDASLPKTGMEEGSAVEDFDENESFIKELMTGVVCAAVSVIKDLPDVALIQNDVGLSRIIPVMEDILKMSNMMRDRVNEIRKYFSPLREDLILQTINAMKNPVRVLEERLQHHYLQRAERCFPKIRILNNVMKELEDELVNSLKQTQRDASSSS